MGSAVFPIEEPLFRTWRVVLTAAGLVLAQGAWAQQFEVAAIRPHPPPLSKMYTLEISGSRVTLAGYNLFGLVMETYDLKWRGQVVLDAVANRPEVRDVMYDITARAPDNRTPTRVEVRQMLQHLLVDRFKLVVHRQTKEAPVYALLIAKTGPKLGESSALECSVHVGPFVKGRGQEAVFSGCAIESLVRHLPGAGVDRPVVDRTGLTGRYDFRLLESPSYSPESTEISPFAAIGELGLKLESQRVPMEFVAIDSFEIPTEN